MSKKETKISINNTVSKHNIMIHKSYKLTLSESKLLSGIISLVNSFPKEKGGDEDFRTYRITVKEAHKMLGFTSNTSFTDVKKAFYGLMSNPYKIEKKGEKNYEEGKLHHWIEETYYNNKEGKGYFDVKLGHHLKKYLLSLDEHFTSYKLRYILDLQSVNAVRMYEMLKSSLNEGTKIISVEDLRYSLQLEDKYPLFANFKIKVLEVTKNEINKKTDIHVSYTPIKKGRKVIALEYNIEANENILNKHKKEEKIHITIENKLLSIGVKSEKLNELLLKYGTTKLEENYELLLNELDSGKNIRNKAGWFIKSIEENYVIDKESIEKNKINKENQIKEKQINLLIEKEKINTKNNKKEFKEWFEKLEEGKQLELLEKYKKNSVHQDKELLIKSRIASDFGKGILK